MERKVLENKNLKYTFVIDGASGFLAYELSNLFHSYWSKGNEEKKYKFIENERIKRNEILVVISLVALVLQNGMKILGVSLPEKM